MGKRTALAKARELYARPKVRRAVRIVAAALAGALAGWLCSHVPEEFRGPCRQLAKVALALE